VDGRYVPPKIPNKRGETPGEHFASTQTWLSLT